MISRTTPIPLIWHGGEAITRIPKEVSKTVYPRYTGGTRFARMNCPVHLPGKGSVGETPGRYSEKGSIYPVGKELESWIFLSDDANGLFEI